jgi:hypothetical protein
MLRDLVKPFVAASAALSDTLAQKGGTGSPSRASSSKIEENANLDETSSSSNSTTEASNPETSTRHSEADPEETTKQHREGSNDVIDGLISEKEAFPKEISNHRSQPLPPIVQKYPALGAEVGLLYSLASVGLNGGAQNASWPGRAEQQQENVDQRLVIAERLKERYPSFTTGQKL